MVRGLAQNVIKMFQLTAKNVIASCFEYFTVCGNRCLSTQESCSIIQLPMLYVNGLLFSSYIVENIQLN